MELSVDRSPETQKKIQPHNSSQKLKTSQRLRYESEARILRSELGSIDDIRKHLGLSRRKMCQLLLIDPSSWTRWMRDETKVPPHTYKALQWYLLLIEKHPTLHPLHKVGMEGKGDSSLVRGAGELKEDQLALATRIVELEDLLRAKVGEIDGLIQQKSQVGFAWKALLIAQTAVLFFLLFR